MSTAQTAQNTKFLDKVQQLQEYLNTPDNTDNMADRGLLNELKDLVNNLTGKYDDIMNANRDLKLGIVGRVKAGKSSFLNALLFDGDDLLPKAATPMTAALTKITYSPTKDEQCAVIHYYNQTEWQRIEEKEQEYQRFLNDAVEHIWAEKQQQQHRHLRIGRGATITKLSPAQEAAEKSKLRQEIATTESVPEEIKAAHELVEMAAQNGINPQQLQSDTLTKKQSSANIREFFSELNDYVGADGKYTPIVKYLELKIHDERLKGFQIVDTPGLNDPVASRVDATHQFLSECDAVLLLSGVSHFLDAQDTELLKKLKNVAIAKAYIIGTMIDTGVLECPLCICNLGLGEAYARSKENYCKRAKEFLESLRKELNQLPGKLDPNQPPTLVSSMFYKIAKQKEQNQQLDKDTNFIVQRYTDTFSDFNQVLETTQDFFTFAGFNEVRTSIYDSVNAEKEQIKADKIHGFVSAQSSAITSSLENINIDATNKKALLESGDVNSLKQRQSNIQASLQKSRVAVRDIFDELYRKCHKAVNDVKLNIYSDLSAHTDFRVETETHTETYTDGWWLWKETHHETYATKKASTNDAVQQLHKYGTSALRDSLDTLSDMLNTQKLERQLRNAILEPFQQTDSDINTADILGPVRTAINKITCPTVDFSFTDQIRENLLNQFGSEVTDSSISSLQTELDKSLHAIYNNVANELDTILADIKRELESNSASFIDTMADTITRTYDTIGSQLRDKEQNLKHYQSFIDNINAFKKDFSQIR